MIQLLTVKRATAASRKGFSLVEMMVALAIASVLMVILVKFVQVAASAIVSGEDRLYATNDAQAAMDLLTTDLQSVKAIQVPASLAAQGNAVEVIQGFGNGSPTANPGVTLNGQGTTKPATSSIFPMDLYLLVTPPATFISQGSNYTLSGAGTPHLIRYKLAWQDPTFQGNGTNQNPYPVMALYRDCVSSSATFGFGAASGTSEVNNTSGLAGLHDLYSNYWETASVPPVSDLLVSNIFDFQILLYDVAGANPTVPLNSPFSVSTSNYYYQPAQLNCGKTFHLSSQGLFIGSPSPNVNPTTYSHLVAEIRMTLVNQQGIAIFNTGSLQMSDPNMATKYAHVFIRRVPINL